MKENYGKRTIIDHWPLSLSLALGRVESDKFGITWASTNGAAFLVAVVVVVVRARATAGSRVGTVIVGLGSPMVLT